MIFKSLIYLLLFSPIAQSADLTPQAIAGTWKYYKKIFRNSEILQPPNDDLRLYMSFTEDGQDRLFWTYDSQNEWCERSGTFRIEKDQLVDTITWINPHNSPSCAADPDMQLGQRVTPLSVSPNGDLDLHLFLDDEPLVIVWKRQGN